MISRNPIPSFILVFGIAAFLSATEVSRIRIPVDAVFGGRPVQAGLYTIEIDDTADKPYLRLIKDQKMIATDIAITLPARGQGKTSVVITKVGRKEFIRIRARSGSVWYFAYLETGRTR